MNITHYAAHEGGAWSAWVFGRPFMAQRRSAGSVALATSHVGAPVEVHALRFENGQEWDAINGSRGTTRTFSAP
jgi:hypothetical protein